MSTQTNAGVTIAPMAQLTAQDRCDRCSAQAYVAVTLVKGGELQFCGHHWSKVEPAIMEIALLVNDQRAQLGPSPLSEFEKAE